MISEIEKNVPLKPFCKEWIYLSGNKRYIESTRIKIVVPLMFVVMYLLMLVIFVKNL